MLFNTVSGWPLRAVSCLFTKVKGEAVAGMRDCIVATMADSASLKLTTGRVLVNCTKTVSALGINKST